MRFYVLFFTVFLSLIVLSCEKEELSLSREELFLIKIGKMEDQLFVQQFAGVNTLSKNRIFMKDGLFYISNGESAKVMEFNSYGEILSLYYNEKVNPTPVLLNTDKKESGERTKVAFSFPLSMPGELTKTKGGDLLIDALIGTYRREYDEESNVELDRIVYRFNEKGEFVSYLGQDGLGGIPFPFIYGLYCNENDEIVVVSKTPVDWQVFWFSDIGNLLYKVKFNSDKIDIPENAEVISIENIIPDFSKRIVYLKIDYYNDSDEGIIDFVKSSISGYNLDSQEYVLNMDLPKNIVKSDEPAIFQKKEQEYLYEFAGVANGPSFFFIGLYNESLYRLTVVNPDSSVNASVLIEFSDEDIVFKSYHLSPNGILSSLVCNEYEARVVIWRSDRFVEEFNDEYSQFF